MRRNKIFCNVNINTYVEVELTEHGRNILRNYQNNGYFKNKEDIEEYINKYIKKGSVYKFQMWDFMHIFGKHMRMGADNCIEKNNMRICVEGY